jgi:hypothetical protein
MTPPPDFRVAPAFDHERRVMRQRASLQDEVVRDFGES